MAITPPPVVPAWAETATDPTDIDQPTNGFIQTGWPLSAVPPSRQFFNWVLNFCANGVRYLARMGMKDWDAAETYAVGAIVRESFTDGAGFTRTGFWVAQAAPTLGVAPHSDAAWAVWLQSPVAQATNYTREIMAWKNSRLLRRFAVDHLGFPAGKFIQWQEGWDGGYATVTADGVGAFGGRWNYSILGGGSIALSDPIAAFPNSRFVTVSMGAGTVGSQKMAHIETAPQAFNDGGSSLSWQCDAGPSAIGDYAHHSVAMGVQGASYAGGATTGDWYGSGTEATGLAFAKLNGGANWNAYARGSTGANTIIDTGIAANASVHRFRIEYNAAASADSLSATANFYIDGVKVATIALGFTAATLMWIPFVQVARVSTGGTGCFWRVGVKDFRCALYGSSDLVI